MLNPLITIHKVYLDFDQYGRVCTLKNLLFNLEHNELIPDYLLQKRHFHADMIFVMIILYEYVHENLSTFAPKFEFGQGGVYEHL